MHTRPLPSRPARCVLLAGLLTLLGTPPLQAQEGLEAEAAEAHDMNVAPPPERKPPPDAPRLLIVHLEPATPEAAPAAGLMSLDLKTALEERFAVVALEDLPAVLETPATRYWETCPEKLECLQRLGDRAEVSRALTGRVYLRKVVRSEVEATDSLDTLVVTVSIADITRGDLLPPITVEVVGEETGALIEAVMLALEPEAAPTPRIRRALPQEEPDPQEEPEDRLDDLTPPQRQATTYHYSRLGGLEDPALLRSGHAGQILLRLSAGAGYGAFGQDYYDYQLITEGNQQVEGYTALSPTNSAGVGVQLAVGYGLGRHFELEAHAAWLPLASTLHLYEEQAPLYELDPWTEEECSNGGNGCPDQVAARGSGWSVGLRARYFPSVARQTRPFLMAGASWHHAPDVHSAAERTGIDLTSGGPSIDPIRSLGATVGPGLQYDVNQRMGLFAQLPVTWWFRRTSQAPYYQRGEDPYFGEAQLPEAETSGLPLTVELELGVQLRFN